MTEKTFTLDDAAGLVLDGNLDLAERVYRTFAERHPQTAGGWFGLGLVAQKRNRIETATEMFTHALALDPSQAHYHHNLAVALGIAGAFDRARAHFEQALALKPDYPEAWYNYSSAKRFDDAAPVARIDALLATARSGADRSFLHFAAGKILDDLGETDRAFAHYAEGNRVHGARFEPAAHRAMLERIRAAFSAETLRARSGEGHGDPRFVFIVGMPRSGTSLAEQVIDRHGAARGMGERPDIRAIAGTLDAHLPGDQRYPDGVGNLPGRVLAGFGAAYARQVGAEAGAAVRITDKQPLNFLHLGLIALLLPRSRIVHCVRSPLDTCLSCYFQRFTSGQDYAFDLAWLGEVYRGYLEHMAHWRKVLPLPVYELAYERMVAEPAAETRRLLAFLELPWDPACLDPDRSERPVLTASKWQVRQPIYRSSVRRSERYRPHLGPLLAKIDGAERAYWAGLEAGGEIWS
ncbi:MAG: sulfotransferase [Paracoccaceae bacterium]